MNKVISIQNLGKRYRLGTINHGMLFKDIQAYWARIRGKPDPFKRIGEKSNLEHGEFWALRNLSFDISAGEIVGIIGRNGAGKSTLLKILSRVTTPTTGSVKMRGRAASLLEVGTGFHPELTGRDNIFLNGAILGMSKLEIKSKLDEIIEFAGVGEHIDTPVKRYSSGMYVRLAFSVAAHLEPEILIIDEVLAVGDAEFQKKCLGKMREVGKTGRTILFVSHNMEAVAALCNRGIVLDQHTLAFDGSAKKAIGKYNDLVYNHGISAENPANRGGIGGAKITSVKIYSGRRGTLLDEVSGTSAIELRLQAQLSAPYDHGKKIVVGFGIDQEGGNRLLTCVTSWANHQIKTNGNLLQITCKLPYLPLIPGNYFVSASISHLETTLDYVEHCLRFRISRSIKGDFSQKNSSHGYVEIPCTFSHKSGRF